jgi:hypothetical protein
MHAVHPSDTANPACHHSIHHRSSRRVAQHCCSATVGHLTENPEPVSIPPADSAAPPLTPRQPHECLNPGKSHQKSLFPLSEFFMVFLIFLTPSLIFLSPFPSLSPFSFSFFPFYFPFPFPFSVFLFPTSSRSAPWLP